MTDPLIAPPDIEAALVAALPGPCSTRIPNPRPSSFTRVTNLGGSSTNPIQASATVFVECWGPDETTALDRARTAWATLWGAKRSWLVDGVWVTDISAGLPANLPDDESDQPRYVFTAHLTVSLTEAS